MSHGVEEIRFLEDFVTAMDLLAQGHPDADILTTVRTWLDHQDSKPAMMETPGGAAWSVEPTPPPAPPGHHCPICGQPHLRAPAGQPVVGRPTPPGGAA